MNTDCEKNTHINNAFIIYCCYLYAKLGKVILLLLTSTNGMKNNYMTINNNILKQLKKSILPTSNAERNETISFNLNKICENQFAVRRDLYRKLETTIEASNYTYKLCSFSTFQEYLGGTIKPPLDFVLLFCEVVEVEVTTILGIK